MTTPARRIRRRDFMGRVVAGLAGGAWVTAIKGAQPAHAGPTLEVTPFVGEIRMWPGLFAPSGWMFCEGQLLSIAENETLFQLIGTTYGGDGQETFGLPDLRGRAPLHAGNGHTLGEMAGAEESTLPVAQIPAHSHTARADAAVGSSDSPVGRVPARNAAGVFHYNSIAHTTLATPAILSAGGSQPHPNMQPHVAIGFIISLFGIFPLPQ